LQFHQSKVLLTFLLTIADQIFNPYKTLPY